MGIAFGTCIASSNGVMPFVAQGRDRAPIAVIAPCRLEPDETAVCFAIEDDLPSVVPSMRLGRGGVAIQTVAKGRVLAVRATELDLEIDRVPVRVRHLLPRSIDLSPLQGEVVELTLLMSLANPRRPTVDTTLRDRFGRLLLWARDGGLPTDRDSHGLAVRTATSSGTRTLAFGMPGSVTTAQSGSVVQVRTDEGQFIAFAMRVGSDDAAFVLVRAGA